MSVIRRALLSRNIVDYTKVIFPGSRSFATDDAANILKSESSDVTVPDITIPELIRSKLERNHRYTAVECASTGRSYTFGQVRTKSMNLSRALRHKLKLKPGDVVAVFSSNIPEFSIVILGLLEARLVPTTLNPLYTQNEVSTQLLDSSAKAIIVQSKAYSTVKAALDLMKLQIPIIVIKENQADSLPQGAISLQEFVDSKIDIPDLEPGTGEDLAFLPYSSGTTGLPKGVELLHRNIVSNVMQASHIDFKFTTDPSDTYQDVTPGVLPFYHIYGFTVSVINTLYHGTKVVTLEKFTPDLYISVLKNNPISLIYAAPPLILFLSAHPDVKKEYFAHLISVTSGAAPLGLLDEERFIEKIGRDVQVFQGYGLTETSPIVTFSPKGLRRSESSAGSIGVPVPNTLLKLIAPDDPTGTPLGPNQTGELLVKGPQVMRGYHNRPEETKNAFLDGWFKTGDIAYYNDKRLVFITDRLKELIKVKGFQVAPAELEAILRNYHAVEDAAVIGIPHPLFGEVPRAYIVPKKDVPLKVEDLNQYVNDKVAKYKRLEGGVQIIDVIPKNPSGKILRRQLRLKYDENEI
ncbi:uncharacterized protein [Leptinotarsa decemlineata]|uniref:uncharacterized protein n=1 Tax=Leptinotarsa decemlineata TaxID=7539 RepID=UPI003D30B635